MSVYLYCKECKSTYGVKLRKCPKCHTPTPKRGKIYRVSVMVNRKRVTRTIPNSIEKAHDIEAKIKTELVDGEYYDRREKIPTLGEIWEDYYEVFEAKGKSWAQDKSRYNTVLKERFGKKPLDQIAPIDIERLISEMKKSTTKRRAPYSPKSIKNAHELLSRIFNYAINVKGYQGQNPCNKAKPKPVRREVMNILEDKQIRKLLKTLSEYEDKKIANLVKLLLFTGMRRGEAFKLTWQQVDSNAGWIYLEDPKSGSPEKIPLNELARQTLKDQKSLKDQESSKGKKFSKDKEPSKSDNTNLVFPNTEGKKLIDIKRPWAKIKEKAEIPASFRLHDLRHTFASLLANSGAVDLYTISKLLTHKTTKMTQRYAHLVDEARKRGTRTLEGIILRAQEAKKEDEILNQQTGG